MQARVRTVLGKQVAQLRRDGLVPGVVYGPLMQETVEVAVDRRDFERFYVRNGHATLFTLEWDGGSSPVFIRNVQQDPVKRAPLHVDFYAPNMKAVTTALVPLLAQGLDSHHAGVLTEQFTELEVSGRPGDIPAQIEVDLSGLRETGDAIRAADLKLPKGVTVAIDPDTVLFILDNTADDRAMSDEAEAPATEVLAQGGEE